MMNHLFPRTIAQDIDWLNECIVSAIGHWHYHLSLFVIKGSRKTLLVDTGLQNQWPSLERQLDASLQGRTLDYLMVTHPETPHSANIPNVMRRHPEAIMVGDMRDYHLYWPEFSDRMIHYEPGQDIDLGNMRFVFLDALLKDLPNSLWGYVPERRVMFVCDGFGYAHTDPDSPDDADVAAHRPHECNLTSAELPRAMNLRQATGVLQSALSWSKFVEPETYFLELMALFARFPTDVIAPAHGNVMVDTPAILELMKETHRFVYEHGTASRQHATLRLPDSLIAARK